MDPVIDTSVLSAEDIKWRNRGFFRNTDHTYTTIHTSPQVTLRKIENIRNADLHRVLRGLPENEHLYSQCALWVHALAGKQFFPDANHRTSMLTLEYLLKESGIKVSHWPGRQVEETVKESKRFIREEGARELDQLWEKDQLYEIWLDHFVELFRED